MNRRLFFRAFAGAPVVAAAAIVPGKPRQQVVIAAHPRCICGYDLFAHGHHLRVDSAFGGAAYYTCINPKCPEFGVAVLEPRLAVERADPAIVARVQAVEAEADREREKAREEEKRRVLGDDWWRRLQQHPPSPKRET